MTSRNHILLVLVVNIGWLEGMMGAAFSNVIIKRDGIPVEYFIYDPSSRSYFENPQAARLSTSSLESLVVPSASAIVTPCLAPCIISNTDSQGLAPVSSTSNAKIITYNEAVSSVPVVMTNKETPRGYKYAYAVYDDHTGDIKSQSEQSDGTLVQGQYSFIQPDGHRREVVYTADDLKGFNAVVRNIAPETEQPKENKEEVVNPLPAPCPGPQNSQLLTKNLEQNKERAFPEVRNVQEPESELKSVHLSGDISIKPIEDKVIKNPEETEAKEPREGETRLSGETVEKPVPVLTNLISYDDIIKCLQAKFISTNSAVSPLTYILVPSLKGPC